MTDTSSITPIPHRWLTKDEIDTFRQDGVLVVSDLLSVTELSQARQGLSDTLQNHHGIEPNRLAETGHRLADLSSTNGSGGVLDLFYDEWKMTNIACHPTLLAWTQQLWKELYAVYLLDSTDKNDDSTMEDWQRHQYGPFDPSKAYVYIDRIGYRLPTQLALELGKKQQQPPEQQQSNNKKKSKQRPLQRGLTPHLDCCPDTFDDPPETKSKWRPIQCFVALTDALHPNHGGLEAAKGFHRHFRQWQRPPTVTKRATFPAPCIGEYTHIRPTEDAHVMEQVQHVPVPAGSVVMWDTRIPHANAYRHDGETPRAVVYTSFLPADIAINQQYAQEQLRKWQRGILPTDQWVNSSSTTKQEEDEEGTDKDAEETLGAHQISAIKLREKLTPLQRKLYAIEPWDD